MTPGEVVTIVLEALKASDAFTDEETAQIVSVDRIENEYAIGVEFDDGTEFFLEVQPA